MIKQLLKHKHLAIVGRRNSQLAGRDIYLDWFMGNGEHGEILDKTTQLWDGADQQ